MKYFSEDTPIEEDKQSTEGSEDSFPFATSRYELVKFASF